MLKKYDPTNIRAHANKTYVTESSRYSFGVLSTFHGRRSIEGVVPELIAGIKDEQLYEVSYFLDADDRQGLYNFVMKNAKQPTEGDLLVLVLSEEDMKIKKRIGLRTSPLEAIE